MEYNQNIQNQKKIKEYIINQQQQQLQQEQNESEQVEYSDNILHPINPKSTPNQNLIKDEEEKNLEEDSDFEEVEENNENNKQMNYLQSQKFKIETYEPIEQEEEEDSDNDDDNDEDDDNSENDYINKERDSNRRKERHNEPKDTRKPNSKEKYYNERKKEKGPEDSVSRKSGNFQFRGTFERKSGKKEELMENQSFGPRDSKRTEKLKSEEKLRNKSIENINENDDYDDEDIEDEPINSNEDIEYLERHKKINPISGAISKAIRSKNKNKIDIQQNINNPNENKNQHNQPNINYIKNEIMPISQSQFGEIANNQTYPSVEVQNESPRFNVIYESQSQPIYNNENNIFQNFQNYQNADNIGPYYNEINSSLSSGPLIYDNMFNNGNIYQQNQNSFGYEIQGMI